MRAGMVHPAHQEQWHTVLYFVRHGETEYNRLRIMQGRRVDAVLNETGRRQAGHLARRFAAVPLDAIYTSPLRRTAETASILAAHHPGVPLLPMRDLEEMSWGVYEGRPMGPEIEGLYRRLSGRWKRGCFDDRMEGGESILEVQTRALRAVRHIVDRHTGETVMAVTHGRLLRVLLASLLPDYGLERMDEILHANTGVYKLVGSKGYFRAEYLNCTRHLNPVETESVT